MWPRKICILSSVFCVLLLAGCDELAIFGGGVAATKTFDQWQANLEAKKAELQKQYELVLAELQSAPDPNAIRLAKQKLEVIADQQLVNEGALLVVKAALERPKDGTPDDNRVFYAGLIAEALAVGYQTLTKRTLGTKYVAHKAGQARFKEDDPTAEAKLYSLIGTERSARGL